MKEGWHGEEYLICFDERESPLMSERYGIEFMLPGFKVVGLCSWDDFLVKDASGAVFTVPTVPCCPENLAPHQMHSAIDGLTEDPRFKEKIKWYVKPLVFGGDSDLGENVLWVSHEKHAELVRWWNAQYRALKEQT